MKEPNASALTYVQMHAHSKFSINPLSGEGAFHPFIWPLERLVMKRAMLTPKQIAHLAMRAGIDIVAITDHNTVPELSEDLLEHVIPGEEWGNFRGHANITGIHEPIAPEAGYFKRYTLKEPRTFFEAVRIAHGEGAFVTINHPFKSDCWMWGSESYENADAVEIWNGPWNEENDRALKAWQDLLIAGLHIRAMAGSDFHVKGLFRIDRNLIVFREKVKTTELIGKLDEGQYSLAWSRDSPTVFLSKELEYHIINYRSGLRLRIIHGDSAEEMINPEPEGKIENYKDAFVRMELWDGNLPTSFTNAVFL